MELTLLQLNEIIALAARFSATVTLINCGQLKPYLKKSEAFRLFGRGQVDQWVKSEEIRITKDGDHSATWRIDRIAIESVALRSALAGVLEKSQT